jgi:hypothetical protein
VQQLSENDPELVNDVAQAKQILGLADGQIEHIVSDARGNDAGEEKSDDQQLDQSMQALVAPLQRIMFKVSTSRKPASIEQLFQDANADLQPGSEAWQYGTRLKQQLQQYALGIAKYRDGDLSAGKPTIDAMRGGKKWHASTGAIYAPFVAQQSAAISALAPSLGGCDLVLSLERGGALVHDELVSGGGPPGHSIPKRTMTAAEIAASVQIGHLSAEEAQKLLDPDKGGKHRIQQRADLRAEIDSIMAPDPAQVLTIAIAETRVGGGSVNYLIETVNAVLQTGQYPNLKFSILALDQTMHRDADAAAEGITYAPVVDADRVKVTISSTEYVLGEDVAYQLSPGSSHAVVVFKGTDDQLAAYKIVPQSSTSSRDIIIDLVDGAYNSFLPGVL